MFSLSIFIRFSANLTQRISLLSHSVCRFRVKGQFLITFSDLSSRHFRQFYQLSLKKKKKKKRNKRGGRVNVDSDT